MGVALIKLGSHGSKETKIEAMLDSLHCEWSPRLNKFLLLTLQCFGQYKNGINVSKDVQKATTNDIKIIMNISLTNFNSFFITENCLYLVLRFNSINFDQSNKKSLFNISGFKMNNITPDTSFYTCVRAEDMKNYVGTIDMARIESDVDEYKINLLQDVLFYWSTNLHLKIMTLFDEIKIFQDRFKCMLSENVPVRTENKIKKNYIVQLSGNIALHIKISDKHRMKVSADEMLISSLQNDFTIENVTSIIAIDDADIFTFEGLRLYRIKDNLEIREERLNSEGFLLDWNKTWGLTINLFKATFPYKHDYAEAIQNEFVSVFKWLKLVHKRTKKPFTIDSPLPSDLLINVSMF